jgi:autotransporter family porin
MQGSVQTGKMLWRPYLKVNLWYGFEGQDEVSFGAADRVASQHRTTALETGGGIVTKIRENVGLYAILSWKNDLDGNTVNSLGGNFGVRVAW